MTGPLVPTKVQTVTTNIAASTASIARTITVTNAGDTLVLSVVNTSVSSGQAATAVSGAGATWTLANTDVRATSGAVDIWVGVNASSGSQTVTVTINGTSTAGCNLDEWQYLDAATTIIATSQLNQATGSSVTPSVTMTPDNLNELVYVASSSANTQTASPGSPYSLLTGPTSSGNQVAGIAYWVTNTLTASAASWTQSSGAWTVTGVVLRAQQPTGYQIWNASTAQNNAGVLGQQAAPDYLDSVITALGFSDTGVQSGCAVGPNLGTDLKFQVSLGTILLNGAVATVAAVSGQVITAADATNPRKDLVYVDGGGTIHYLAGVANATPCLPLPPIFPFVALAEIDVPANATQLDTTTSTSQAHVTDKRVMLQTRMNYAQFTSSGTWNVPSGVTKVLVRCVQGGGGGGGGGSATYPGSGGAGGVVTQQVITISGDTQLTITCGSGGSGGAGGPGGGGGVAGVAGAESKAVGATTATKYATSGVVTIVTALSTSTQAKGPGCNAGGSNGNYTSAGLYGGTGSQISDNSLIYPPGFGGGGQNVAPPLNAANSGVPFLCVVGGTAGNFNDSSSKGGLGGNAQLSSAVLDTQLHPTTYAGTGVGGNGVTATMPGCGGGGGGSGYTGNNGGAGGAGAPGMVELWW